MIQANSLALWNVGDGDGGMYQCFHTNTQNVHSAVARIIIQGMVTLLFIFNKQNLGRVGLVGVQLVIRSVLFFLYQILLIKVVYP